MPERKPRHGVRENHDKGCFMIWDNKKGRVHIENTGGLEAADLLCLLLNEQEEEDEPGQK